jgi:hypothetical protein
MCLLLLDVIHFSVYGVCTCLHFFSTLSLVYSVWFPIVAIRYIDKSGLSLLVKNCFRVALISLIVSTAGPLILAVGKALQMQGMELEVKSVYWFLHFQYNGFFFFSVAGFYCSILSSQSQQSRLLMQAFICFAASLLPAYLLSIQWLGLSWQSQALASISGALQIFGLLQFISFLLSSHARGSGWLYSLVFVAFILKKFVSIFPAIGKIAFGFWPIMIGYLHLLLFGLMTTFIL